MVTASSKGNAMSRRRRLLLPLVPLLVVSGLLSPSAAAAAEPCTNLELLDVPGAEMQRAECHPTCRPSPCP